MAGVSTSGPGAIRVRPGELEINADRGPDERGELRFTNTADRPIQVGSHLHLPDVNPGLEFDRAAAAGFRLDIPAGTSHPVRAGRLAYGGDRRPARAAGRCPASRLQRTRLMARIAREAYAAIFGPTAGDQIRLGDTDLWIEIEQDLTFGGEESVFGGGKSIRESGNQAPDHLGRGRAGHRDHQRGDPGPLGHRPRRRRDPGRPDRRHRPQRQPRHRRRGRPGAGDRAGHRRDLRRGQDPHRRRLRLPRALPVAVADRRGAGRRADHAGRRRHRALGGVQGHHGDPGRLAPQAGPPGAGRVPGQPAAAGQGQHRVGGGLRGAGAGRRRRLQGARGLGLHPGGRGRGAEGRGGVGAAGRPALRLAERGRIRGQHRRRRSAAAASRPSTSRAPAAGTPRTS